MEIREKNILRFKELMGKITREGKEELLHYIETETDFYTAPASTNFHLSCEGGLLQHSLNVYECLAVKKFNPLWAKLLQDVPEESLIISALMHDLCKTNFYVQVPKNVKTYDPEKIADAEKWQVKHDALGDYIWETILGYQVDDQCPYGHGEKSAMLIEKHMRLTDQERYAIRWHMGYSSAAKEEFNTLGKAMEISPLVVALHEADLEASKYMEDTTGNKNTFDGIFPISKIEECPVPSASIRNNNFSDLFDDDCPFI